MKAYIYMLRLWSGTLYVGWTTVPQRRFAEHASGRGGRTTRLDPPISIVYSEQLPDAKYAKRREQQLKHWTRAKKESLIRGDLQELKALAKRRGHESPRAPAAL